VPLSPYIARLRQYIGHDTILAAGAAAVIQDEKGLILLMRRSDGLGWSLPAGMMEPGESIAECIKREVREETGLEVEPVHLAGIYSDPALMHVTYPNGDQVHYMSATFRCRITGGSLQADGDEAVEIAFFAPDSLPETTWPMHRLRIEDALVGREAAFFR
jgi:8-oxo-dGTP diphosphatase